MTAYSNNHVPHTEPKVTNTWLSSAYSNKEDRKREEKQALVFEFFRIQHPWGASECGVIIVIVLLSSYRSRGHCLLQPVNECVNFVVWVLCDFLYVFDVGLSGKCVRVCVLSNKCARVCVCDFVKKMCTCACVCVRLLFRVKKMWTCGCSNVNMCVFCVIRNVEMYVCVLFRQVFTNVYVCVCVLYFIKAMCTCVFCMIRKRGCVCVYIYIYIYIYIVWYTKCLVCCVQVSWSK